MKINVKNTAQSYLFEDIECGEVFYDTVDPDVFMLRTDLDTWVAINLRTGVAQHISDFNRDDARYRIVEAEVTIS